ncbi:hypothetical protein [Amycolatopsis sp. NPDC006125]|uniref:hypothetical protein n=1 Tax=Amycolatopsis sp. NPDC006125 TaxID=3156730 RepID=UPI0033A4AC63
MAPSRSCASEGRSGPPSVEGRFVRVACADVGLAAPPATSHLEPGTLDVAAEAPLLVEQVELLLGGR